MRNLSTPHFRLTSRDHLGIVSHAAIGSVTNSMKISLKARNVPRLLIVWAVNIAVFSGVVAGGLDVRDFETLRSLFSKVAADPGAGWPYGVLLTMITMLNGAVPRLVKERLVFWPAPRPGSRAFNHFMLKDSTINRKALQQHFCPLPSDPDEQNALWAGWLNEFEDDARVRPSYGLYLFARDWTTIAVTTLVLAGPIALCLAENSGRALWYAVVLLGQCAFSRWLARVQGEQLVMSVLSCKGSSLGMRSDSKKINRDA